MVWIMPVIAVGIRTFRGIIIICIIFNSPITHKYKLNCRDLKSYRSLEK